MEIKELYEQLNGNYQDVMGRLMKEERVLKYLRMLPKTEDFQLLCDSVAASDWPTAFRASHSLKGMAANLGLTVLFNVSSDLCEEIRDKDPDLGVDMNAMLEAVRAEYEKTINVISTLG